MAATVKIPTIFTAVDKYSKTVNKMARATNNFAGRGAKNLARMERRVRSLTPSFGGLNRMLGGFGAQIGGALLVAGVGNAIKKFAEFEQANAGLAAVMGVTVEANKALAEDAKRLGATTAKTATEVVGLQEAYARLGFSQKEILDVTEATIAGSVAMNAELADTAELTGAMIRTFDNFSSADAPEILDQMTVATQKSALSFEKLQTSLPIVAGAANAAGISFTETQALLGKLSDAGIDASSSATALRNIFLESAKQGLNYDQILNKIVKEQDKLTAANDEFGKRGAVSAVILAKNLKGVTALNDELKLAAKGQKNSGAANKAAAKQLDTLNGSLTLLGSAYEGFILSLESGEGAFGNFLKTAVRTASEILAIASGTEKASDQLSEGEKKIRKFANSAIFFGKTLGVIVGLYTAANVALKVWRIGLIAFNVVQGIATALQGGSALALRGSAIAMQAYAVATKIVTGVQWLLNAAMAANPIGLIIIGIIALIALIAVIIAKYNEWGAALSLVLGPLGFIINLIQSFRRNWDMIKKSFAEGGILAGFKAIGATILDAILMPLQQVFELMTDLPGVGEYAQKAVDGIEGFRKDLGVNVETDESGEQLVNPAAAQQEAANQNAENIAAATTGSGVLTIANQTENEADFSGSLPNIDVQTTSTQAF